MSGPEFNAPSIETMNTLLPAFEFGEIMASNDLGAVYFANQKSLDRQVALKLFSPALGMDGNFKKSFDKSAQSVAGLRHPNLIGFFDSGVVDKMPFIVMEFVPGKSLARSTDGKVIEFSQSMAIIEGVCAGIAYAHENDLVHGNLDTMNILLNQKAEPKIGNFGLSKSVHTGSDSEVPTHFTAPEVLAGGEPAKASDLYSIAAIFYELITGRPYTADAPPASSLTSSPPAVDEIIRKATLADPGERSDDANEFFSKLKRASGRSGPKSSVSLKPAKKQAAQSGRSPASNPNRPAPAASVGGGAKSGFDSNLFLKIIVIVILLIAVQQLWSYLKVAEKDREEENKKIIAEQKAEREEALAAAKAKRDKEIEEQRAATANNGSGGGTAIPEPPQRFETPMESLERLSFKLKEGRRAEMPVGSVTKGENSYFLVTKPMTWVDASAFAEENGGHLALPDTDLSWLPDELTKDRSFWAGAARSGKEAWTMVDGKPWSPASEVSGKDLFVLFDESGKFETANARKILPFVIQWRMDGSNPATREARLASTAATIKTDTPVFPPGTVEVGERRYLHVSDPVNWGEAQKIAESVGGNLLVISNGEEAEQVKDITDDLKAYPEIWVGGYLKDDLWFWSTNEPWNGAEWINEQNATKANSAMIARPGRGWDAMDKSDKASGFIIEWSDDPSTNKGSSGENVAAGDAVGSLTAKAKGLLADADKKRMEALAKNIDKLKWDLNALTKTMAKGEQAIWIPVSEELIACVKDNRLWPVDVVNAGIQVSPEMDRVLKFQVRKQEEADEDFAAAAEFIRKGYLEKLKGIYDEAKTAGQIKIQKDATEMREKTNDLEKWVKGFGIELKPEPPEVDTSDFDDDDRFKRRRRDFDDF